MNPDNVTHCQRCNENLERGYSGRWKDNECIEVICFKCDKKESLSDHMKTGVITTHFMMDCLMSVYDIMRDIHGGGSRDTNDEQKLLDLLSLDYLSEEAKAKVRVQLATTRIQNKFKDFESRIWFAGLQDRISATNSRGVSAKLGKKYKNFCVLTWTGMARTMITIEDDDASVTCVIAEDSKESTAGFHGIRATGEQAITLIDNAIKFYEDGILKFKDDEKVSLF